MKTQYFLNNKVVAEFDETGNLVVLDPSVLIENRHSELVCSNSDNKGINLVHHLHLALSTQKMNSIHKCMLNSYEDESE